MPITYPPAMLPAAEASDEYDIVVDGKIYRWRDGRWLAEDGTPLHTDDDRGRLQ